MDFLVRGGGSWPEALTGEAGGPGGLAPRLRCQAAVTPGVGVDLRLRARVCSAGHEVRGCWAFRKDIVRQA